MTSSSFDYVIIGAGSAGCVLASRLTEDDTCKVLLLEAGPKDNSWQIHMPASMGRLLSTRCFNWDYLSEPEPYLNNRRLTHPRGRVLGGSSSINGMVYMRGHAQDYDAWAKMGLSGWSYSELLPYFKRAEKYQKGADSYRGDEGPLHVSRPDLTSSMLTEAFIAAAIEAGYPASEDVNGDQQEGFGRIDQTIRDGHRWSVAKGYLRPALKRTNLTVVTGALVHKINLRGSRAYGVDYAIRRQIVQVKASREIILSAGAINSPQLLQLSGIGDPKHLNSIDIEVEHALPGVGANLNDHPDIVIQHRCLKNVTIYPQIKGIRKYLTGLQWFMNGKGAASSNHFEVGGFIRSRAGIEHPDLQLTFMPLAIIPGTVNPISDHAFQVHIDLMRPKSLGSVKARSNDPEAPPAILFNYLKDSADRSDLRNSILLTREILSQKAMTPFKGEEIFPGINVKSNDQIDAWVRRAVETCYHPVGTCKMGMSADEFSVVDDELKVRGIDGLRVVDASIMPRIVSGNTNAPTIAIAEKASDMIRGKAPLAACHVPVWVHPNWQREQR